MQKTQYTSCAYVKNNKPPLSFRMPWRTRTRTIMVQLGFEPETGIINIGTWVSKSYCDSSARCDYNFLWALCFYNILAMKLQNIANLSSSDQSKFIISILTNNILPNFIIARVQNGRIWIKSVCKVAHQSTNIKIQ